MALLPGPAGCTNSRCPGRNPFPSTLFVSSLSKGEVERLSDKDTEKKKKHNTINFFLSLFLLNCQLFVIFFFLQPLKR